MGHGIYWDEDVARESSQFHADREAADRELPDASSDQEEWAPDNRPLGRLLGRTNADTYITGEAA